MFPKIGVPPNHPILAGFSIINHPFWGYPYFRKHPNIPYMDPMAIWYSFRNSKPAADETMARFLWVGLPASLHPRKGGGGGYTTPKVHKKCRVFLKKSGSGTLKSQGQSTPPPLRVVDSGVSFNGGTPKSSILVRFSIISHPFWGTQILWKHPFIVGKSFKGPSCLPSHKNPTKRSA